MCLFFYVIFAKFITVTTYVNIEALQLLYISKSIYYAKGDNT